MKKIDLLPLKYQFTSKPLLVGGRAKEYYGIRKSGPDTDLVVSQKDYENLAKKYPENKADLFGDLGVKLFGFEIWSTISWFNYDFLSEGSIGEKSYKIISLEKLLFLTALAIKKPKYLDDLRFIVRKIEELQRKKGKNSFISSISHK
ncbi:hypothetical protein A3F32_01220 [Candidatus Roizmanbacteria bacterium RIFCSPHIGHO2_12_FULL_42_10]|uniref:Poly A polymerase head domain-containing protein n=3 Tax=Candidatus Roizmaniibacteriota TaxID=1752723 RepID=A0A1F7GFR4_9BACT|nr:MAG: hypothetical protein A2866_02110 [Candidatus Roizmanbacteria bacterium RIFCSPHIGHO2_01_FULL_39_8]OGK25795.1 MAG: hypothetical protein A3C28_00720 [Candidatus Roizmanbacteria bacterium RIFCSPHIGHO2_02_FULL_39_9]OGK38278.1 MAG: hypothetical protein A3F32_01220 [Candidatus Roizmanbacteria bacterium RIFCSPHIGHO2_12_FULL_42_10]